ncbi:MAG: response regulator [Caenispirillum bisanense]|nr:response regulator [Caenispirillum bisanense]MCA1973087.1 response regulator [Caenispirillum sp.]
MRPESHHILIVEDEQVSRAVLAAYLNREGYQVSEAANGDDMDRQLARRRFDLVLLDINLPGRDGLSLLRTLRAKSDMGIILVTAKSDAVDRVVGLELGADDYVVKPYEQRELLARVKNILRRAVRTDAARDERATYHFDGWRLDTGRRLLTDPSGINVPLTTGEFNLLATLAAQPQRVFTRDRLLDAVSNREWSPSDRSIDVLIGRLRKKLEQDAAQPRLLVTVRNVGYVFTPEVT